MALNIERFKVDLGRLINEGTLLEYAMRRDTSNDGEFLKQIRKQLGKDADALIEKLPKNFGVKYESWYSEAVVLLRQILPDRVSNFISLYEKPKSRKDLSWGNYVIQDFLQGLCVTRGSETLVGPSAALSQFRQQLGIVKAAQGRFESSLFEIRQLVQADVFDNEIAAARELLSNKFVRAAGAITGVVLEKHLLQVCEDHGTKITKKNPSISDLNEALRTAAVIDVPQWRYISMLGDLRNLCAHNKKQEPTSEQVSDFISGTEKVLKTIS
ncbi:hypothetical protein [Hyphomicrobium sp.]|jgi:hypothetical protein|uniref:hypothetical protein n=1 Tax=Hyphomicrobium sp. TaxID=82 RepID=UPI00356602BF